MNIASYQQLHSNPFVSMPNDVFCVCLARIVVIEPD